MRSRRRRLAARRSQKGLVADRGAAGMLLLAGGMVVVGAAVVAGALVAGALVHGRCQAAADMAAIAATSRLLSDPHPCAAGSAAAAANSARLAECSVSGQGVTVTVTVPLPAVLRLAGHDEAAARARAELRFPAGRTADDNSTG